MPDLARHSSRSRLLFWLLGLVAISLLAIVLTTRTVLLNAVPEKANEDVVQELEEFRSLAQNGVDPETSQPFASNTRLLKVFLSRQIPTRDEALVGLVDGKTRWSTRSYWPKLGGGGIRSFNMPPNHPCRRDFIYPMMVIRFIGGPSPLMAVKAHKRSS